MLITVEQIRAEYNGELDVWSVGITLPDGTYVGCGCATEAEVPSAKEQVRARCAESINKRNAERLWHEVNEALSPTNARPFDGDNNYKKCLVITTCIVGGDKGEPTFVLDAKSPRSAVNNLGMSINWSTNARAEAAAFLRKLATKIEENL